MNYIAVKIRWSLILFLAIASFFIWAKIEWVMPGRLRVAFLAVGQGDAILIRSAAGRTVLIDGGPGRNILEALSAELPFFQREIDLVIETHPDTDHAGGLPDVLARYQVFGVLKPCLESRNPYDRALTEAARERQARIICARPGQVIDLGGGARMEILSAGTGAGAETNAASIVARLSYGETDFFLAGDAPESVEKYLLFAMPEKIRAEIYKVSHHGSRESNEADFLNFMRPTLAVISVGKNRYGHPHQETLDRLANLKSVILRTDLAGTIRIETDGRGYVVKK